MPCCSTGSKTFQCRLQPTLNLFCNTIVLPSQQQYWLESNSCGYGSIGGKFCCTPLTFAVRGVRSDLSTATGFATLSGTTLIVANFTQRQFLTGEEFVQVMKIETIMTNAEGATATQFATITIYNCAGAVP